MLFASVNKLEMLSSKINTLILVIKEKVKLNYLQQLLFHGIALITSTEPLLLKLLIKIVEV